MRRERGTRLVLKAIHGRPGQNPLAQKAAKPKRIILIEGRSLAISQAPDTISVTYRATVTSAAISVLYWPGASCLSTNNGCSLAANARGGDHNEASV